MFEALYLTFTALLDPGDEVIIPTPCFVSYQAEVHLAGGVPVEIPTYMADNFQPRPELIEKAITPRTKAIFIGYPNNPTGAVASRETLLEIARLAEKYDLMVVSDEIYDRLVYEQELSASVAAGHVGAHDSNGRFLQSLRDDRLAHRLWRLPLGFAMAWCASINIR